MNEFLTDSTQCKTFSDCPMKYKLNYVDCLKKAEYADDSVDIRFGEAIHKALELFDEKNTDEKVVIDKFISTFVDLPGEKLKTTEHGIKLLQAFFPYYRANFKEWQTISKEQIGEVMIGDIKYLVKIDRVVKWRDNIYCVDFKTTKSTRKHNYFDQFNLAFQPTGYIDWVKQQYGQCSGFIPLAMFMGYRENKYKGEPAGFHCSFDFTICNRTGQDIELWQQDIKQIKKEIDEAIKTGVWRRNPGHCGSYSGCSMRQICESCYDPMVMESLYIKVNPNEYLGK